MPWAVSLWHKRAGLNNTSDLTSDLRPLQWTSQFWLSVSCLWCFSVLDCSRAVVLLWSREQMEVQTQTSVKVSLHFVCTEHKTASYCRRLSSWGEHLKQKYLNQQVIKIKLCCIEWQNNLTDSPRIFLIVVAPREAKKVTMKAFWRNVTFWNWLAGSRIRIPSRLGAAGIRLERKSISEIPDTSLTYSIETFLFTL